MATVKPGAPLGHFNQSVFSFMLYREKMDASEQWDLDPGQLGESGIRNWVYLYNCNHIQWNKKEGSTQEEKGVCRDCVSY